MAVVSRVSKVRLQNGVTGDFREWLATATTQDTAAGQSVTVTVSQSSGGGAPPAEPNQNIELNFYVDNGSTLIRSITDIDPTTLPQVRTFHFTDTGAAGGSARLGTVRMRLRVEKTNGGPTATYHVDSDGTNNTPPTAHNSTLDRGWIRGTGEVTGMVVSNVALGGAKNEPAQYQDGLYVRATVSAQSYTSYSTIIGLSGSSKASSVSGTGTQRDVSFTGTSLASGRVNEGFLPNLASYIASASVGTNSTLTGLPWTVFASVTVDSIQVDPRVWAVHLFQLDDNSYGTPPLSKQAESNERPGSSIGYFATGFHGARGGVVGDVMSGGINGITAVFTLTSQSNGSEISRTATTGNNGGEDGWTDGFMQWTSPLPGGVWLKVADITSPTDIDLDTYLVNAQSEYILLAARSPYDKVKAGGGNAAAPGRHFSPGDPVSVFAGMWNTKNDVNGRQYIDADAESDPVAIFTRPNTTTLTVEYLDASYNWVADPSDGTPLHAHNLTQSPSDSRLWFLSISGADTANWGTGDIDVEVNGFKLLGVAYDTDFQLTVVGGSNQHDLDSSENVGVVTSTTTPDFATRLQEPLQDGYGLQIFVVPRTEAGVDPKAATDTTGQISLRYSGDSGAYDWDGTQWWGTTDPSHPNSGAFILMEEPTITRFGSGALLYNVPAAAVSQAAQDNAPWIIISGRIVYDEGQADERAVLETVKEPVIKPAGEELDALDLALNGTISMR